MNPFIKTSYQECSKTFNFTGGRMFIGITGQSGSGKTAVKDNLVEILEKNYGKGSVVVISQDNYYITNKADANFDEPAALEFSLLVDDIKDLKAGKDVDIPVYDFGTHSRTSETIPTKSAPIIILEGIFVLTVPEVRNLLDYKVYVNADDDDCFSRRIIRDREERGRTLDGIIKQYTTFVTPSVKKYVKPSKEFADIIINNNVKISQYGQKFQEFVGLKMLISAILWDAQFLFQKKQSS